MRQRYALTLELTRADWVNIQHHVLDGDPGTAWAEGVDGAGVGESLDFAFSDNVQLVGIEILNGYNRTAETVSNNGRVRLMRITTNHEGDIVNLDDSMAFQTVDGDFGRTDFVRLTIESVYPGERFDDTLVSEVAFLVRD